MPLAEVLEVTLRVARILEELGVPYLVGGSLASSLHGIPRSTQDVDLVAALRQEHVEPLLRALQAEYYVSADAMRDAIRQRSCFNLIEQRTVYKIDIFVLADDALSRFEMQRREEVVVDDAGTARLVVASAEDIVLQKLAWFRLGGESSERQWRDAQGVLKVQRQRLDLAYLRERAAETSLVELLDRALGEAGL